MNMALQTGETEDGKCFQDGAQLFLTATSTLRERNEYEGALQDCEIDRADQVLYPATEACMRAATEVSLARNVSISVKEQNVRILICFIHALRPAHRQP